MADLARIVNQPSGDARRIRSRRALTSALLALLEEQSFDQITIRAISARAGTGYATFFRHYPDKESLLADVASQQIADLLARAMPIFYDGSSLQSCQTLCRYVADHRTLWAALLTGGAAGIVREEFIRQARRLDQPARAIEPWLPSDLGVVYGTGATIDLLAWWLAQTDDYPSDRIADILHRLIIAPLMSTHSPESERG